MTEAALTESGLVILVPEAERAVSRWRKELDPSETLGIPAHITLLYPFAKTNALTDTVTSKAARVIRRFQPFDFALDDVKWFGDTVVWLAPNPSEPFIALTKALLETFPEFPRYGGSSSDEVVPHLTVGEGAPLSRLRQAAARVAETIPIHARAQEVALLTGAKSAGSWRVSQTLPLG